MGGFIILMKSGMLCPKHLHMAAEQVANPQIVHYNLFYKPWHFDHIMYEQYFWKYADESPFAAEIHQIKRSLY